MTWFTLIAGGLVVWATVVMGRERWRRSEAVQARLWSALELAGQVERHTADGMAPLPEAPVPLPPTPRLVTVTYDATGGAARVGLGRSRQVILTVRGGTLDARWVRDGWRPEKALIVDLAGVSAAVEFPEAVRLELTDRMVWVDLDGATTTERLWVRAWLLQGAHQARRALVDATPDAQTVAALERLRDDV